VIRGWTAPSAWWSVDGQVVRTPPLRGPERRRQPHHGLQPERLQPERLPTERLQVRRLSVDGGPVARIAVPPRQPPCPTLSVRGPILSVRGPVAAGPMRHGLPDESLPDESLPDESLPGARLPCLRVADQGLRVEQGESGRWARAVGGAGMRIAWHAGHGRSAR
jgi:hypothetical protein